MSGTGTTKAVVIIEVPVIQAKKKGDYIIHDISRGMRVEMAGSKDRSLAWHTKENPREIKDKQMSHVLLFSVKHLPEYGHL